MNLKRFYIGGIYSLQWQNLFEFCLNSCNKFIIHFPENPDGYDKELLLGLQNLQSLRISPWKGCKNFNEISGTLSDSIRCYFRKYIDGSLFERDYEMWDYQLLLDDRQILYVGDCSDKLVCFTEQELGEIKQLGMDITNWSELNIPNNDTPNESSNIEILDIEDLEEIIQSFLNGLDKS